MTNEEIKEIPESGAVFTFGKSRFADNIPSHFFVRKDPIIDISCGDEHTVVICQNGRAFSFGRNSWGELGLGHRMAVARPNCIKCLKPKKCIHVACGRAHTLILSADNGRVYVCGNNDDGQLGLGDVLIRDIPQEITSLNNVKQLSAGSAHSAALTLSGQVYMWGSNKEGQLGVNTELSSSSSSINIPKLLDIDSKIIQIACGYYHTLLLTEDGRIISFGEGDFGKLGVGGDELKRSAPTYIKSFDLFKFISAGGNHSAAITLKGKLLVWGSNIRGQLGLNQKGNITYPTLCTPVEDSVISFVSCGENHTAVMTENSILYTFGDNTHGKLCLEKVEGSSIEYSTVPIKITKFDNFLIRKVECGGCHTMVLAAPSTKHTELANDSDFISNNINIDAKHNEVIDTDSLASSRSSTTKTGSLPPVSKYFRNSNNTSLSSSTLTSDAPPILDLSESTGNNATVVTSLLKTIEIPEKIEEILMVDNDNIHRNNGKEDNDEEDDKGVQVFEEDLVERGVMMLDNVSAIKSCDNNNQCYLSEKSLFSSNSINSSKSNNGRTIRILCDNYTIDGDINNNNKYKKKSISTQFDSKQLQKLEKLEKLEEEEEQQSYCIDNRDLFKQDSFLCWYRKQKEDISLVSKQIENAKLKLDNIYEKYENYTSFNNDSYNNTEISSSDGQDICCCMIRYDHHAAATATATCSIPQVNNLLICNNKARATPTNYNTWLPALINNTNDINHVNDIINDNKVNYDNWFLKNNYSIENIDYYDAGAQGDGPQLLRYQKMIDWEKHNQEAIIAEEKPQHEDKDITAEDHDHINGAVTPVKDENSVNNYLIIKKDAKSRHKSRNAANTERSKSKSTRQKTTKVCVLL